MERMQVSCLITVPGGELEINDGEKFVLGANARASTQVTWRRQDVSSPFVPGTWTVSSVQENVNENVEVYVYASDHGSLRIYLDELVAAFTQHIYTVTWDFTEDIYAWYCQRADYQIDTRREFQHSRMAIATFSVPRYPALLAV